jgi:oligoendopeptidase F
VGSEIRLQIALLVASAPFLLNAHFGLAEQSRSTAADLDHYVWDLSSLYPDRAAWERERATIDSKLKVIGKRRGTLGRDAKSLADGLEQVSDLRA